MSTSDLPVVVFQGEPGAYSEKAAFQLLGTRIKTKGLPSFEQCYTAVESSNALFAMLPVENSLGGSIHSNYDLQLRHNLHVVAELDFRVEHCLIALPGVKKEDIKFGLSHPQALAQCDRYLRSLKVTPKAEYDTAGSAKIIAEQKLTDTAAIASSLAAKHFGLNILEEGIEDHKNNYTRFLLLSRTPLSNPMDASIAMKSSIVFSTVNSPGVLFKALAVFTLRDIDLSKIESRPDKLGLVGRSFPFELLENQALNELKSPEVSPPEHGSRFRYMFYIDITQSCHIPQVKHALSHLCEIAPYVRVLGCYPKGGVLLGHVADAVGMDHASIVHNPAPRLTKSGSIDAGEAAPRLRIGIVGFGNFGQFIAKTFARWHTVKASSRTDYSTVAKQLGVEYFSTADEMVESGLDVIVLATSILSFETVVKKLPLAKLANVLVVDVLSVKLLAKEVLQELLPASADILCTHPMFGPESGKYSWRHLPCVYEKVRVDPARDVVCETFLNIFRKAGCRMVNMTCETHDQAAAGSQFVTHLTGRMLSRLQLSSTPINTKGFETLLALVDNTCKDSFDLFYALYRCNPNSASQLKAMKDAIMVLEDELHADKRTEHAGANASSSASAGDGVEITLASRIGRIQPSKTGAAHAKAMEMKRQGKDVITTLVVGEPDFPPPKPILDAIVDATSKGEHTRYTSVVGTFELRDAISTYLNEKKGLSYDPNTEILVTAGGKQAIYQAIMSLCEKGDEVIIPAPYWVSYPEIVRVAGAEPVILHRKPENGFILSAQELDAAITPKTKLFILCNPCNPTGAAYTASQLEALAQVLRRPENQHVLVITDEIYERLVYDIQHVSFASLDGMKYRSLVVNGFAKAYAMTGYRLGYICGHPKIIKACLTLQSQLSSCASSLSQHAGVVALKLPDATLRPLYTKMKEKRDFVIDRLNNIPGIVCPKGNGAFYAFPDVSSYFGCTTPEGKVIVDAGNLCVYLLEDFGLALTDGAAFGAPFGIRLSYATSMEDLAEALGRFEACLASLGRE